MNNLPMTRARTNAQTGICLNENRWFGALKEKNIRHHLRWPHLNADDSESEHAEENDSIPPFGNLRVARHKAGVDIGLLVQGTTGLDPDLLAEVQERVHQSG